MQELVNKLIDLNVGIWVSKLNEKVFINNKLKKILKIDSNFIDEIDILEDEVYGLKEDIKIEGNFYNKVLLPLEEFNVGVVTKIKDSESFRELNLELFETLINSIPEIIFCKDTNYNYSIANDKCYEFYEDMGIKDIIGKSDPDFKGLDENFTNTCRLHDMQVIDQGKTLYIDEVVPTPKGIKIYQTIKTPIVDKHEEIIGMLGSVRDVTEQKKIEEKLKYLSYTDVSTGAYNRSYFEETMNIIKTGDNFCKGIIMSDLNALKFANDIFGHLEGDNLIKTSYEILKESCENKNDLVFRWGGDEFVTIIDNGSDEDCLRYMERVKENCNKYKNTKMKVSISQGYTIFDDKDQEIDELLKKADKMLYTYKPSTKQKKFRTIFENLVSNFKDKNIEDKGHIKRVEKMATELGCCMNFSYEYIEKLRLLALVHNIGKIAIDEEILLKKEPLTEEEFKIIREHTTYGEKIANNFDETSHISKEVLTHHERWDGTGYPMGLKGEDIPILSRIFSVINVFDIMLNGCVYKPSLTLDEAIQELKDNSGTQFDPYVVEKFVEMIEDSTV
ncbi:MAG: diguanylate cyclase [Peptostreptococcaceae bacterium]